MMHDTELRRALTEELARDPALDATRVGVTAGRGIVELGGRVRTREERLAARRAVRRVSGVRVVVDALEVARADDAERDDGDIAHDILRVFETEAASSGAELQAEVRRGVVTLSGTLERQPQRLAVETRVGRIAGVHMVSSLIGLATDAPAHGD